MSGWATSARDQHFFQVSERHHRTIFAGTNLLARRRIDLNDRSARGAKSQ